MGWRREGRRVRLRRLCRRRSEVRLIPFESSIVVKLQSCSTIRAYGLEVTSGCLMLDHGNVLKLHGLLPRLFRVVATVLHNCA